MNVYLCSMSEKPKGTIVLRACGGINPETGKRVGSRHSWPAGWGVGACKWCHRTKSELEQ